MPENVAGRISYTAIARVSGETVRVSGETVSLPPTQVVKISGETVSLPVTQVVKVSGETLVAKVSGEAVRVSGQAVVVSGQLIRITAPTLARTNAILTVTGASGGAVLHSGVVVSVVMKALSTNSGDLYVGSTTNPPYSGFGFQLAKGEALSVDIGNFNVIRVISQVSGDKITFYGVG